jgi:integrase
MAKAKRGNNEGSVYQLKDGSWMASMSAGRDPATGKIKRKSFRASTRQEANRRLQEAQGQAISGSLIKPGTMTVGEWVDIYWRDYVWPNMAIGTASNKEKHFRVHVKPALGHIKLQQLRVETVQRWYNRLIDGGLAISTAQEVLFSLQGALKQRRPFWRAYEVTHGVSSGRWGSMLGCGWVRSTDSAGKI